MSSLSNQQINSSFSGLLQVPGGITSSLQTVQDGNGNPTGLQISSSGISGATTSNFVPTINGVQITGSTQRLISDGFGDFFSVKDFGAIGNGIADDTSAIQAAINAGGENSTIYYPKGTYKIQTGNISVFPQQNHVGSGAIISVASGINAFVRSTDGFPGRIQFKDLNFVSSGKTSKAIYINNNSPFVEISNCSFSGFDTAVYLKDSYSSNIFNSYFVGCNQGIIMTDACHSSQIINCLFDICTYGGICINGNNSLGKLNTTPTHNITIIGCSIQNGQFGLWAESTYELQLINIYHEGNTNQDIRIGVADSGSYQRACYNSIIEGWQTSSSCSSGINVKIEHSVNLNIKGMQWNYGCSTTAPLLSVDGYSDLINLNYSSYTTTTTTTTSPFTFGGDSASRVIVSNSGIETIPYLMKAINFGTISSKTAKIYANYTPGSGRPTLQIESLGSGQDVSIKVQEIERHYDSSDNLRFSIDHLNSLTSSGYQFSPITDNNLSLGNSSHRWSVVYAGTGTINTSDAREKTEVIDLTENEVNAAKELSKEIGIYQWLDSISKKGQLNARKHIGFTVQKAITIMEKNNLNPMDYGFICYDKWDSSKTIDGEILNAGDRYSFRYDELNLFLAKGFESRLCDLESKL